MVHTRWDGGCAHHRTQNSELRVHLGNAEHGGQVAGDLWGTLDIDPNPNGILPLHLLVTLNTDPRSVAAQRVRQRKRVGVVGGSVSAGVENPRSGGWQQQGRVGGGINGYD